MHLDPVTVWVFAATMMLLNGAVLGLVHRGLAEDVKPSVTFWRTGTLLFAGACILQAVQSDGNTRWMVPFSNLCFFSGLFCYWRSLHLFHSQPQSWLTAIPPVIGALGILYFSLWQTDLGGRVVVASFSSAITLFGCLHTLWRYGRNEESISRPLLMGSIAVVAVLMLARGVGALWSPPQGNNLLETASTLQYVIMMISASLLPVIGTTVFLMMCSERLRRRWQATASTDYLTGLPNRRTIAQAGDLAFADRSRELGVAVLDLDHFKTINDRYGHEAGDAALRHLAELIGGAPGEQAMVGRLGGEEFLLLWTGRDAAQLKRSCERLLAALRDTPFPWADGQVRMTASIGLSHRRDEDVDFDAVFRRADQALYQAKSSGRDRVELAN